MAERATFYKNGPYPLEDSTTSAASPETLPRWVVERIAGAIRRKASGEITISVRNGVVHTLSIKETFQERGSG